MELPVSSSNVPTFHEAHLHPQELPHLENPEKKRKYSEFSPSRSPFNHYTGTLRCFQDESLDKCDSYSWVNCLFDENENPFFRGSMEDGARDLLPYGVGSSSPGFLDSLQPENSNGGSYWRYMGERTTELRPSGREFVYGESFCPANKKNELFCNVPHCDFRSQIHSDYVRHVLLSHQTSHSVCCKTLYPTEGHFEAHRLQSHELGNYKCSFYHCRSVFHKKFQATKHENDCHSEEMRGPINCSECFTILPHPEENEYYVKNHALSHLYY